MPSVDYCHWADKFASRTLPDSDNVNDWFEQGTALLVIVVPAVTLEHCEEEPKLTILVL